MLTDYGRQLGLSDTMGVFEVAKRLGVSRPNLWGISDLPTPVYDNRHGREWLATDIEAFAEVYAERREVTQRAREETIVQVKPRRPRRPRTRSTTPKLEELSCADCGAAFLRPVKRGRKPNLCDNCKPSSVVIERSAA